MEDEIPSAIEKLGTGLGGHLFNLWNQLVTHLSNAGSYLLDAIKLCIYLLGIHYLKNTICYLCYILRVHGIIGYESLKDLELSSGEDI